MVQMTWRAPDELAERVRRAAELHGWSVNAFLTRVLDAATDPELAESDAERVRERLRRAGLLVPEGRGRQRPDAGAVERARARAGQGTPLADLVRDGRG